MAYSPEKLSAILKQKKSVRGALTRAGTFISSPEKYEDVSKNELLGRVGNLTQIYEDFKQLLLYDIPDIDASYIDKFETDYFAIKAKYDDKIQSMNNSSISGGKNLCHNVNFKCDVPLSVPKFSGDVSEFTSFFELFTAIIHKNASLEPIQKLFVLRSVLQGKAIQLIEHLELIADNYIKAYDLLRDYYQNNRFIIFEHIKNFMDVELCLQHDAKSLRTLIMTTRSSLRSLEACGVSTKTWDTLLIYIVLSKLDSKTRELWEGQYKTISEIGKLDDLFSFLEQRANLLACVSQADVNIEIEAVRRLPQRQSWNSEKTNKQLANGNVQWVNNCSRCGRSHKQYSCPAWKKKCNKCGNENHFAKQCKSKLNEVSVVDSSNAGGEVVDMRQTNKNVVDVRNTASVSEITEEIFIKEVGLVHKKCPPWTQVVRINKNYKIEFKIDTGADASVLPVSYVNKMGQVNIVKSSICVVTYMKERIPVIGTVSLLCECNDKTKAIEFLVVDLNQIPLLGLSDAISFDLIKRINMLEKCDLITEFDDIFNGVGRFPYIQKIVVNDKLIPFIERPRRLPYAIRDKVKNKLIELENKNIIKKIDYSTLVVNPTVVVEKKNGDIRICLDMRKLNQFIQRENYVVPTLEDIISSLEGKSVFTVLDLKEGYHQIELDEESSNLCAFETIFGRYKFCRLPFGVTSAPEIFQKQVNRLFGDIPGVCIYFDDILVTGSDEANHDRTLREVFERARRYNIKINKEKVQYKQKSVRYLGHIFSNKGIAVDDQYLEAILKMPMPKNKEEVLRFLGIVKYVSRFIPNLSEISAPLRELTKMDVPWVWSVKEEQAVNKIRDTLGSASNLAYFDEKKRVEVHTDASKWGLGAVLMQDGRPVLFASRSLSSAEQKYAVIEKEMLAVQFGVKKFHQFVYGKPICVVTDHKPLVSIFKKDLDQLSPRLQRLRLKLIDYNIRVVYKPGKEMVIPDTLSRAYLTTQANQPACNLEFVVHDFMQRLPMSDNQKLKFMAAIKKDVELGKLKEYIVQGWPNSKKLTGELQYYYASASQIVELEGLLLFNNRVIVPKELRPEMLKLLHEAHLGIEKTKERARQVIIWPRMMLDIENYIKQCEACQKFARSNIKQPMISHTIPNRPWQKLFTDIMTYKSNDYLIVVDAYSFWVEVLYLTSKSANAVIEKLKVIFSRFGIPEELIGDNVPFAAESMKIFAQDYQFNIITRSPNYPQANSFAERAVGIIKSIFKKIDGKNQDLYLALLEYRNTPLKHLNVSPSQLLMNRIARTKIPISPQKLQPTRNLEVEGKFVKKQKLAERYYNRGSKELDELIEGDEVYIQYPNQDKWNRGKIKSKFSTPRSYLVQDFVTGHVVRRNRGQLRKANTSEKEEQGKVADQEERRNCPRRRRIPNYLEDYVRD